MNEKETKQLNLKLMETADWAYLATIDKEGFPQVRVMANLRNKQEYPELAELFEGHEEDLLIYFATGTTSVKMGHIESNPKTSVYFYDAKGMQTLLLAGTAKAVSDEKLKKAIWQERWKKHFPGGCDDPEYTVLRFVPVFVKGWCPQGCFEFSLKQK